MGFLIAFLALFLLLLVALGFASIKLFTARDAQGNTTAPGCLLGCATGLALTVVALLGLFAFLAGAVAIVKLHAVDRALEKFPAVDIGIWKEPGRHVKSDPERPVHVVLEWEGHSEPSSDLMQIFDELRIEGRISVAVDYVVNDAGNPLTVVDVAIPVDEREYEEFEDWVREHLPAFDPSTGVKILLRRVGREDQGVLR